MAVFPTSFPVVAQAPRAPASILDLPASSFASSTQDDLQSDPGWRAWLRQPAWVYGLVLVAMLVGGGLRFARLTGVPPGFNQDEAVYAYDAYSIFHTGRDHHGHPFPWAGVESFGPFSGAVLSFIEAPFVGILGLHVEVVRGVSSGFDLLLVPIVALLAVELFESWTVGVVAAWVVALLPWAVENARFANLPAIVPTIDGLTLLLLVYALRHRSNRAIVAAAVAGCTAMATYHTMKIYLPMLVIVTIPFFWRWARALSREAIVYALMVTAFLGGPVLFLTAFDPSGRARADGTMSKHNGIGNLAHQYLSYFSRHFLIFAGDDNLSRAPRGYGVLLWSLLPLLAVGLIALAINIIRPAKPWNRAAALFVLAALVLYPFPGFFTLPVPNGLRAVHVIPIIALIAGLGFASLVAWTQALARWVRLPRPVIWPLLWIVPIAVWFGFEIKTQYQTYFGPYPNQVASSFNYGLDDGIRYALDHQSEYDQIWVANVNQPYIFVLFYGSWPPNDVHAHMVMTLDGTWNDHVSAIGNFRFPYGVGQAAPKDILAANLPVLETIKRSNGKVGFEVRGGVVPNRGKVLVIMRP